MLTALSVLRALVFRMPMPDGTIIHADLTIGDSHFFVMDEPPVHRRRRRASSFTCGRPILMRSSHALPKLARR
jgi:uncharacterized glyoxalase superfamily protein PhnB